MKATPVINSNQEVDQLNGISDQKCLKKYLFSNKALIKTSKQYMKQLQMVSLALTQVMI